MYDRFFERFHGVSIDVFHKYTNICIYIIGSIIYVYIYIYTYSFISFFFAQLLVFIIYINIIYICLKEVTNTHVQYICMYINNENNYLRMCVYVRKFSNVLYIYICIHIKMKCKLIPAHTYIHTYIKH